MPITRRTLSADPSPAKGWTHLIETRHFTAGIRVIDRHVKDAEPQLHWTIGQRLDRVIELCNNVGSEVKPVERKR